ncbi:MAG TPA: fatty acyl-AMP ligase [Jatrophihabitantaceae bacterium]|nr:fatty acyl-AMP ligase [Jatrophihabitantaceae bacterium]
MVSVGEANLKTWRGGWDPQAFEDIDLIDCLERRAGTSPEDLLYIELMDGTNESARLTARELRDRASDVAGELADAGVRPGDVVLLIASPPIEFLIGLLGCMWAGVIAAPISFPRRAEHLESRLEPVRANAGAVAILAGTPQGPDETAILELLAGGALPVASIPDAPRRDLVAPQAERDIAYLQYTSGSTSDPRGVVVGQDNLMANLAVCDALLDFDQGDVNVSWCPLTHDMGLIMGALPSIPFGMMSVLMPPAAFIRRPLTWLRAMDRYRGTHGYSPNFGYDLCVSRSTEEERAALDLSSVRTLINGAEPVRPTTRDAFLGAFAVSGLAPTAHAPGYGLAESSVLVSAAAAGSHGSVVRLDAAALEMNEVVVRDGDDAGIRVLCADGVPGPGYDIRIVDPDTSMELPVGRVGELWVRGPSVCRGYWRRDSDHIFGAHLVDDDAGPYLRTGDLGFLYEGEIVICGRAKDLIVIRGRNIHPQDVELTAEFAHPAVHSGGTAAFAVTDDQGVESIAMLLEVSGEPDELDVLTAVSGAVLRDFELHVLDVLLVKPYSVPKTSSGKKQRGAAREIWREARRGPKVSVGASPVPRPRTGPSSG